MRVRNADVGMHLWASGVNHAFVNSNTWVHGAVSGGGFSYGILAEGPGANNNNIFIGAFIDFTICTVHVAASKRVVTRNTTGTIIEPPVTSNGHLVVTGEQSQILASV